MKKVFIIIAFLLCICGITESKQSAVDKKIDDFCRKGHYKEMKTWYEKQVRLAIQTTDNNINKIVTRACNIFWMTRRKPTILIDPLVYKLQHGKLKLVSQDRKVVIKWNRNGFDPIKITGNIKDSLSAGKVSWFGISILGGLSTFNDNDMKPSTVGLVATLFNVNNFSLSIGGAYNGGIHGLVGLAYQFPQGFQLHTGYMFGKGKGGGLLAVGIPIF